MSADQQVNCPNCAVGPNRRINSGSMTIFLFGRKIGIHEEVNWTK